MNWSKNKASGTPTDETFLRELDKKIKVYESPARLLIIIALSVFTVESAIMLSLATRIVPGETLVAVSFIDASVLVALLSPILYFFLFRPLILLIEKKRSVREALRQERDLAQEYLDIAGVMIVALDVNGRVTLINKKGCDMLGYNEDEIIGKNWVDEFVPSENRSIAEKALSAIIADNVEIGRNHENAILTKSGEKKYILWHNTVLKKNGVITHTLSSGEDITERRSAVAALKESEEKYRLVHNTAFDGIVISNSLDSVVECNPSAERLFGYETGEMSGMDLVGLMPEHYREDHSAGLKRFLSSGASNVQGKVLELEGLKKNGEIFPIELILGSFLINGTINFTGTIRDITERRQAERDKEIIQAQLNQSQKMEAIGRLAGGIAHDFNNIISTIQGNAELMLEDIKVENPAYERVKEVMISVSFASKLTRQLLIFSRGETFRKEPLDINRCIENLTGMLKRIIGKGTEIRTELATDLSITEADDGNIEQVLMNLAVNARDAMPSGGVFTVKTGNATLTEEQCRSMPGVEPGRYVLLSISDTGYGMEKEVAARVFEPFFTTKPKGKGTGLGLSVVYGIVRQHEGGITVNSTPGSGTVFNIYLRAMEV